MHWFYGWAAWIFITLVGWNAITIIRDITKTAKQLHRIPCANCQFFSNNYYLKCPVHPDFALTEEAINCSDYLPESDFTSNHHSIY